MAAALTCRPGRLVASLRGMRHRAASPRWSQVEFIIAVRNHHIKDALGTRRTNLQTAPRKAEADRSTWAGVISAQVRLHPHRSANHCRLFRALRGRTGTIAG